MLRISVLNERAITRLKLEGKLAHEWVREAEIAWGALPAISSGARIVIDLMNVAFVDDAGYQLLANMRHAGAELLGSGPLISALIEEIEDQEFSITGESYRAEDVGLVEDEEEFEQ